MHTATGNAALKLNRIHYLRPTRQERQLRQQTQITADIDLIILLNEEFTVPASCPPGIWRIPAVPER